MSDPTRDLPRLACAMLVACATSASASDVLFRQTAGYAGGGPSITISTLPELAANGRRRRRLQRARWQRLEHRGSGVAGRGIAKWNSPRTRHGRGVPARRGEGMPGESVSCARAGVVPYEWQGTFGDTVRLALPTPCELAPGRYWLKLTALTGTSNHTGGARRARAAASQRSGETRATASRPVVSTGRRSRSTTAWRCRRAWSATHSG